MKIYLVRELQLEVKNTNLLNSIFNIDKMKIMEENVKNMIVVCFIIVFIILFILLFKKDFYYANTFTKVGDDYILVVDNDMVKEVELAKKIIINNHEKGFSINKKEQLEDTSFLYVRFDNKDLSSNGIYKIYLGKETLFEYIIRIIKK